ncbi:hypothetical protein D3C76_1477380 [compost metagenome]
MKGPESLKNGPLKVVVYAKVATLVSESIWNTPSSNQTVIPAGIRTFLQKY